MKQLPHIASLLYGQPWAILPQHHAEMGALYRNYLAGNIQAPVGLSERERKTSGVSYESNLQHGIALISLTGCIGKRIPDADCGPPVVDLCTLDALLDEVAAEPLIETVILDMDSPGGMMTGLDETCSRIREMSAHGIRMIAYTEVQMCSAAYYLACACDEIYSAPTAAIGSIGVYCAGLDDSRAWEMDGMELILAKSGSLKAIGHPGKSWQPEERAWLQNMADRAGEKFRTWVRSRRGDVPDDAMQGQFFFAEDADQTLLDGIYRDIPALLADLMRPLE